MKFIIIKKIRIEAGTLEEAIANHNKGETFYLTAEEYSRTSPVPPMVKPGTSLRNAPR